MTPAIPHAATVLLLREIGAGLQVLMTKRAPGLTFMAGLWVFPGGRMEPSDLAPELAARSDPAALDATSARLLHYEDGQPLDPATARGLLVAACRETFEESGVLLARPRDARTRWDAALRERVAARRAAAAADPAEFARLLADEDLLLDLERLVYWAHWITPTFENRRFDTRFLALQVPDDQEASVDHGELTHHAWLGESEVRAHVASGEMKLAPPTRLTLEDLWAAHRAHGGLQAMLEAERTRSVPPILPRWVAHEGDEVELVLPWDAGYASTGGEGCAVFGEYPACFSELPARMRFPRRR
jgi:8-oxo-dGTP pyrophosphatase MutT (NUDIX family)